MESKHLVIEKACNAIGEGKQSLAKTLIESEYPFTSLNKQGRKYTEFQKTKVFLRDGFTDRYSGEKLVFPPVLRLLSHLIPEVFPFQKNWKMSECHLGYWQLLPTIDHIVPVSRGGEDVESNWVCTSQLRNNAKSNWMVHEIGWHIHEAGSLNEWDGLISWFMAYANDNQSILGDGYLNSWYRAGKRAIET